MKKCSHCLEDKDEKDFYKNKKTKDGLTSWCKQCIKLDQQSKYYGTESDYRLTEDKAEYRKKWHRVYNRLPSGKYYNLKFRAKKYKIEFNISKQDFSTWWNSQNFVCHYCGRPLIFKESKESNGNSMNHLTIDRRNSKLGYYLDNMVLACRKCNTIKGNWFSELEMLEIAKNYLVK